jgi:hypothetical protein
MWVFGLSSFQTIAKWTIVHPTLLRGQQVDASDLSQLQQLLIYNMEETPTIPCEACEKLCLYRCAPE